MTNDTYNGWSNYPTWAVALWLSNEPGTDEDTRRNAADWNERTAVHGGALSDLADDLRAYVEHLPDVNAATARASLTSDLLGFALAAVNWLELAEHHTADLDVTADELERRRRLYLSALTVS